MLALVDRLQRADVSLEGLDLGSCLSLPYLRDDLGDLRLDEFDLCQILFALRLDHKRFFHEVDLV